MKIYSSGVALNSYNCSVCSAVWDFDDTVKARCFTLNHENYSLRPESKQVYPLDFTASTFDLGGLLGEIILEPGDNSMEKVS